MPELDLTMPSIPANTLVPLRQHQSDNGAPHRPSDGPLIARSADPMGVRRFAVARNLALLQRWGLGPNLSPAELAAIHAAYGPAIALANALAGHAPRLSISPYRAALAGPLHLHRDTPAAEAILRFATIVRRGMIDTEPSSIGATNSALTLRRYLLGETHAGMDGRTPQATFRVSEYALRAFLDGRGLKRLQPGGDQDVLFPLPCPESIRPAQMRLFD